MEGLTSGVRQMCPTRNLSHSFIVLPLTPLLCVYITLSAENVLRVFIIRSRTVLNDHSNVAFYIHSHLIKRFAYVHITSGCSLLWMRLLDRWPFQSPACQEHRPLVNLREVDAVLCPVAVHTWMSILSSMHLPKGLLLLLKGTVSYPAVPHKSRLKRTR